MIFKALFIFSRSRITGDTAPSFDSLSYKLEFLKKGIEMKVDSDFQRSFAKSLLKCKFLQRWRAWKRTLSLSLSISLSLSHVSEKVASLETDTASELKQTTKAIDSMDKNLEQRFDEFKAKFHNKMVAFEKKVVLRYFLTANSFEQDRRWKNLKDL